ncbi:prephenate dehydrogenase [Kitasatospora kazusensis]|uniref:Prephenate dehydrogenase n=1 Tax=Kitasatospora kazusensis TaxID=407974 RepID=A0ABN2YYB8_9ACTN
MSELPEPTGEHPRSPLRSVAVVGTGLIGTSVALALTAQGVTTYLLDQDPAVARTAEALGAGIAGRPDRPVDLAVLAVPPSRIVEALAQQQAAGLAHSFTDVASVKLPPQRAAVAAGCDLGRYVGGHPMAGRERSGPLAATADLFHGRTWVLTPSVRTGPRTLHLATELIRLCGAELVTMSADLHDRTVALTSHTPHVLASLMAGRLTRPEAGQLRLSGQGLRDVTRVALGDPQLWTDILRSNAGAVASELREVADDLAVAVAALEWLDDPDPAQQRRGAAELHTILASGVAGRSRLPELAGAAASGGQPPPSAPFRPARGPARARP